MVITDKSSGITSTENRLLSAGLYSNLSSFSITSKPIKKSLDSAAVSSDVDSKATKFARLTTNTVSSVPKLNLTTEGLGRPSYLSVPLKLGSLDAGRLLDSRKLLSPRYLGNAPTSTLKYGGSSTDNNLRTLPPLSYGKGASGGGLAPATSPAESCAASAAASAEIFDVNEIFESPNLSEAKFTVLKNAFLSSFWTNVAENQNQPSRSLQDFAVRKKIGNDYTAQMKLQMVDRLASALISMPNFSAPNTLSNNWVSALRQLSAVEPEFILKLSLYAREELNIRTAANFLVAFAAFDESTRPYLSKYFAQIVRLPNDWLEIVELGQFFASSSKRYGEIPKALRLVMVKKFSEFDAYQLAKYNKEKARMRKAKKPVKNVKSKRPRRGAAEMDVDKSSSSGESDMEVTISSSTKPKRIFTLKRMIRCLHISEPVFHVMSLLGKRYPSTDSEFYNARLPGSYDKAMAGKRMKLPIPETWETQISMKGNKAEVWESLLSHRKLPYMALLRNIRNLLRAGISERHHRMALDRLSDREAVIKSRQLPIRFFSAYEVLTQLQRDKETFAKWKASTAKKPAGRKPAVRRRGKPADKSAPKVVQSAAIQALAKLMPKAPAASLPSIAKSLRKSENYSEEELNDYKKALNIALQVATTYNIQPIRGRTLVFCDMGATHPIGGTNNPLGPCRTAAEAGALLGFMCKSACEQCDFYAYSGDSELVLVESEKGTILDHVQSLKTRFVRQIAQDSSSSSSSSLARVRTSSSSSSSSSNLPGSSPKSNVVLNELLRLLSSRSVVDSIVWLDGNGSNQKNDVDQTMADIAKMYIETIHPSAMFVHVDLSPTGCRKDTQRRIGEVLANQQAVSPYLIHLAGFSDAILRFVAERTDASRLRYIDNIDKKYQLVDAAKRRQQQQQRPGKRGTVQLSELDLFPTSAAADYNNNKASMSATRTVRIFISSTFRDMHGERDLLTRYVIPQIRLNAAKIGLQIYDVDLRWGVTEDETRSSSLLVCLAEAKRADLFIGILGERYGYRPGPAIVEMAAKQYPEISGYGDRSVTELEIRVAMSKNVQEARNRVFFYFRDSSELLTKVPMKMAADFEPEDAGSAGMLKALKSEIRRSGLTVLDGYSADYGGLAPSGPTGDGKVCRVSNLEEFGERVTLDLWGAITRFGTANHQSSMSPTNNNEFDNSLQLHTQRLLYLTSSFVGRGQFCVDIVRRLKATFASSTPSGLLVINGVPGCGKSAVVAQIVQEITEQHAAVCLYYFADASPSFATVRELVNHFGQCLLRVFRTMNLPNLAEFEESIAVDEGTSMPSFADLLNAVREINPGIPLLLVIDALDAFQGDQAGLSFLPENIDLIPDNVILLLSCRSGSLTCLSTERLLKTVSSTRAVRPLAASVEVPQLPVADRAVVIKAILARYGKQLADSAWDNQMSALTQKKHAGLPAYLALACEELRLFGLFEELSLRVRRLPHTLAQLLADILSRLETDHGKTFVEHACCLLAVAPSGLTESDLRRLIGIAMTLNAPGMRQLEPGRDTLAGVGRTVKMSVFCKLLQSLRGFFSSKSASLAFGDSNMTEVIDHVYFGIPSMSMSTNSYSRTTVSVRAKSASTSFQGSEKKAAYCRLIATYYCAKFSCEPNSPMWADIEPAVLTDLPYLLTMAGCYRELARILTSLHYLAARCTSTTSIRRLLGEFQPSSIVSAMPARQLLQLRQEFTENRSVQRIEDFVRRNIGSLSLGFQHLLWQSAFNDADSAVRAAAMTAFDVTVPKFGDMAMIVRLLNDADGDSNSQSNSIKPTLVSKVHKSILCVDICQDYIAFGSEDTTVSVFHRNGGGLFRTLVGHAGPVTAVCFSSANSGTALKLFTASHDKTLSIWDVLAGNRQNIFENHQRPITGCSSVGRLVATSSTDCTVAVYDVVAARLLVRIYDSCPLNAVALHPAADGRVVVGCWDSAIRLWSATPKETTTPRRLAVFRGHASPVTAVAFSPCGMYIASGSLDGEVRLFLADHGVQVGVLGGQNGFAVTCLRYLDQSLVSASADWAVRVWSRGLGRLIAAYCNGARPQQQQQQQTTSNKAKLAIATSTDGLSCATTSSDNELIGLATKSGQLLVVPVAEFMKAPGFLPSSYRVDKALSPVLTLAFTSSEPRRLVYGCQNGSVRSIDVSQAMTSTAAAAAPANKRRFDLVEARSAVGAIAAGFRYTATGSSDSVVRVYENHPTLKPNSLEAMPSITFTGHRATVTCLYMDETYLLSGDMEGTVFLWSLSNRRSQATIVRAHGDAVSAVALTKDHIVTTGSDTIKAWTLTGEPFRQIGSHLSLITSMSCVEGCIVTGDCDGVMKVHTWRGVEVTSIKTSAASVVGLSVTLEHNKRLDNKPTEAQPTEIANWAEECDREEQERELANRKLKSASERQRNVTVVAFNSDGWIRAYRPLEAEVKLTLKAHVGAVTGMGIAPSNRSDKSFDIASASHDGTCLSWNVTNTDEGVPDVNNVNNCNDTMEAPIRAFFTCDNRYFIVASISTISVWRTNAPFNMVLATRHQLSKVVNDVCPCANGKTSFYACTDTSVIAFCINENDNAPLYETILPIKNLIKINSKSSGLNDAIPFNRILSHPFLPSRVYVIPKFYEIEPTSSSPMPGLSCGIEHFVNRREIYAAVPLADGRVHFLLMNENQTKASFEFTALSTEHPADLPLVTFLPSVPGCAVVVGHRSGAVYIVGPIATSDSGELSHLALDSLDHQGPVTCIKASRKFILSVSASEQLVKFWRLTDASSPKLRLVGLLPFDCGKISSVSFLSDLSFTADLLGGNGAGDGIVVVDHLSVIRRYAVISN